MNLYHSVSSVSRLEASELPRIDTCHVLLKDSLFELCLEILRTWVR